MVATIGPVAGVAVHVELGYYPEGSSLISRWGTAFWDRTGPTSFADAFTRADSTTTLGAPWIVQSGTWGISSGRAYETTGASHASAVVDVGGSAVTLECTIATVGADSGLVWRATNDLNYFLVNPAGSVYSRNAGSFTLVGSFSSGALVAGDVIKIVLTGNTHTCYVNGVSVLTFTSAFNNNATRFGIRASGSTASRFDTFSITGGTGAAFWESGTPPRDDISCDVEAVKITTGRDQPLDRFRASTCSVTLNDPAGKYSPWATATNTPSYTVIRPGIDLFVWIETDTDTYYRFAGRVDSITDLWPEPSPDLDARHQVVFQAHDMLGELAAFDGVELPPVGAGELTGARVGRILTNAGYQGPRTLDVGTVTVQATTLAKNAVDEIGITTDTEQGAFFATGDGQLRFLDRNGLHADTRYTTVQAIFGDAVDATEYRPVSASSGDPYTYGPPGNAVDGDPETWWLPDASVTHAHIIFDRGTGAAGRAMGAVWHRWYDRDPAHHFQPVNYTVVGSPDGVAWYVMATVTGNTSVNRVDRFAATTWRYFGLDITAYEATTDPWAHLALVDITWFEEEICYTDIQLASDSAKVRNLVSIGRVNGAMADRADLDSQSMFGVRTYRRTDLMHETDALSPGIADDYLQTFAYAANRVERVTVQPTVHPEFLDACLRLGPLQLIEVRRRTRGFQAVATLQIEAVTESIAPHDWSIEFTTFPATGVFDVGRWDRDTWGHGEWGY